MGRKPIISRRLKGLMAENDMSVRDLSRKIGISEGSLNLKINGQRPWWLWETIIIVKFFGLSEIKEVFPEAYEATMKTS